MKAPVLALTILAFFFLSACQRWEPLPGSTAFLQDPQWECVPGFLPENGTLTIRGTDEAQSRVNRQLPHLQIEGSFGISTTLRTKTQDLGLLSLWQEERWLAFGLQNNTAVMAIFDGQNAQTADPIPLEGAPGSARLQIHAEKGQYTLSTGSGQTTEIRSPGLFTPGEIYFGASVSPNNEITILGLNFETLAGQENALKIIHIPEIFPTGQKGLRDQAPPGGVWVGASVGPDPLRSQNPYSLALAREFNILTPENALKFGVVHPEEGRYDFCQADTILAFARTNSLLVRGHTLVWEQQLPEWVRATPRSQPEWASLLEDHIFTVAGRYSGQISSWDVVNEAFSNEGQLKETLWLRNLGPGYIEMALRWARSADPQARLFLNDVDNEQLNPKSDAIYALAQDLLARGVPLDGIGFQMHLAEPFPPDPASVAANFQRFADLGLEVQITEFDVRIPDPVTPEKLARQADIYRDMMAVCLAASNCNTFVMWGVSDAVSWIPYFFEGWGSPLILDEDYLPKPAYLALQEALENLGAGK